MDETRDPKRHLELEGAQNVRDLGGYTTMDGDRTRWRRFLRSDGMHLLTEADQDTLLAYGVGTVIDLRMSMEVEKSPNVFTNSNKVVFHHLDLMADLKKDSLRKDSELSNPAQRFAYMYQQFLSKCRDNVGKIMATLADAENNASMYHCAGGKDRTGVISALLLGIAGVPDDTIAEDYALTSMYPTKTKRPTLGSPETDFVLDPLYAYKMVCPPEAMLLTLGYLKEKYGSVKSYLRWIGLTAKQIDRLKSKMLEA
ncbi:MAG: tyrosine-protein phosphatase [Pseudomonadales bacterium]|nr:tyrosine-protein phosphatase [Pseudomonadales bacterium]MDP7147010.1 tyrosine-protein phosphatase [Pseudomonadales bacterium]MDP7359168.1 tyrosine-protein phosphatase [Pseudomonadales bacterium]MDP7596115.1 tyrosine-protein phosphatase [Pseudomonadales bacterium]HJN50665.1 tyrosine-protein phosphatase [Pseudomonadales bacterium]